MKFKPGDIAMNEVVENVRLLTNIIRDVSYYRYPYWGSDHQLLHIPTDHFNRIHQSIYTDIFRERKKRRKKP